MTMIRTYSELILLPSFIERYRYLRIAGTVGKETFGFDRYLNQIFYKSDEWLEIRDYVIDRDNGCDLGVDGFDIEGCILIHHMNPISKEDFTKVEIKIGTIIEAETLPKSEKLLKLKTKPILDKFKTRKY